MWIAAHSLKADGEALVFYENDARVGTVPLAPLSRVFLRVTWPCSPRCWASWGARIGVVVLSGRKAEPTLLLGRPHNDAARRVAQYRLSTDSAFCLAFARAVVEAKLRAQAAFLAERRDDEPRSRYLLTLSLRRIDSAIAAVDEAGSIASLRGWKGNGAAAYFEGFSDLLPERLHFSSRNRRPPKDPVNAVLSLGYTLLHAAGCSGAERRRPGPLCRVLPRPGLWPRIPRRHRRTPAGRGRPPYSAAFPP